MQSKTTTVSLIALCALLVGILLWRTGAGGLGKERTGAARCRSHERTGRGQGAECLHSGASGYTTREPAGQSAGAAARG